MLLSSSETFILHRAEQEVLNSVKIGLSKEKFSRIELSEFLSFRGGKSSRSSRSSIYSRSTMDASFLIVPSLWLCGELKISGFV